MANFEVAADRARLIQKLADCPLSDEQMDEFNKIASKERAIHVDLTLHEATTLLELLSEARAVSMMRAAEGYPKDILATMVNVSSDLTERIGESTHNTWEAITERLRSNTPMKES